MRQGMPFDIRRRCELALTRCRGGDMTQDEALQEIFRLMKRPEAASVLAREFQNYVDAIMEPRDGVDAELEAEVYKTWRR